jgi:hypothetical protein
LPLEVIIANKISHGIITTPSIQYPQRYNNKRQVQVFNASNFLKHDVTNFTLYSEDWCIHEKEWKPG